MRKRTLIAALLGILLLTACAPRTPTKTPIPSPTAPVTGTAGTLMPSATPSMTLTPTATLTPTNTRTPTLTPPIPAPKCPTQVATPAANALQISEQGTVVYRVPDTSSDLIISVELNPVRPELLVNLYDGLNGRIDRVRWDGADVKVERAGNDLFQARYSPDASALVFGKLAVGCVDGSVLRAIAPGDAPSWSPDGAQIAFIRRQPPQTPECVGDDADQCSSVVIYDRDTGSERTVLTRPYLGGPPQWSPDRKSLLVGLSGEVGSLLGKIDVATGKLTVVLPNDAPDEAKSYSSSVWSPDSAHILYTTQANSLWSIPAEGGRPVLINETASKPHLSPSDGWVYYLKPLPLGEGEGLSLRQEIWRLRPSDPNSAQAISPTVVSCNDAAWSSDARVLACIGTVDNQPAITLYAIPIKP